MSNSQVSAQQENVDTTIQLQQQEKEECSQSPPHLIFPGGGVFFYWQAGAVTYLREQGYQLDTLTMSGASAGALTATLAVCNVDYIEATHLALKMAEDENIWERRTGLQGIWGSLIETWLYELLPEDSALDQVKDRLSLLITPIPFVFKKTKVDKFESLNDLINCNMVSVHLPWFLDGKLVRDFRGEPHIDGSFLAKEKDYYYYYPGSSCSSEECASLKSNDNVIRLDWKNDPEMSGRLFDFVRALSRDSVWDLLEQGKKYAKIMEERGDFEQIPRKR